MSKRGSNKKIANSLVAVSSAAVLSVYAAGYARTRSAAQKFDEQTAERRPVRVAPAPVPVAALVVTPAPIAAPANPAIIARVEPVPGPISTNAESVPPSAIATAPELPLPSAVTPVVPPPAPVAVTPAPPPPPPTAPAAPTWKDGKYLGWGTSRHGDIQAAVVIEGGRIASASIAQCLTRYSCDVIEKLPPEVAQRQSPEVDYVSGATQSANAFYSAVVEALSKAR